MAEDSNRNRPAARTEGVADDAGPVGDESPPPDGAFSPASGGSETGADPKALLAWAFGTFHTTALVSVAVFAGHSAGTLGDAIAGLDTPVGIAAFLYLWAIVWWTNRKLLARAPLETPDATADASRLALLGIVYGATAGLLFFAGALLVIAVALLGSGAVLAVVIVGGVGGAVAAVVGGAIGLAFALIDVAVVAAARSIVPGPAGSSESAA